MPPRGNNEGLDFSPILTHYLFLFTSALAVLSWFIAFIGQAIATAKYGNGSVGVLWFAIFLQLAVILGVLYTLASDSISMHRFQLSVFGAIAIVFAVMGVNQGIYAKQASLNAMGAGWLILAMVDILWVLYFTSEEDSLALHVFNSMGTGGLTPPSRRRRTRTAGSIHNMAGNGGYAANYSAGGGVGNDAPYDTKLNGSGIIGGMGMGAPNGSQGIRSHTSFGGASGHGDAAATRSLAGTGGAGSIHSAPQNEGLHSPLMAAGPISTSGIGGSTGTGTETIPLPESYSYKAKALYAYQAAADDPNEISFSKGEILDIVDKQGKWWQAKKLDGSTGIAPSNYLQII